MFARAITSLRRTKRCGVLGRTSQHKELEIRISPLAVETGFPKPLWNLSRLLFSAAPTNRRKHEMGGAQMGRAQNRTLLRVKPIPTFAIDLAAASSCSSHRPSLLYSTVQQPWTEPVRS